MKLRIAVLGAMLFTVASITTSSLKASPMQIFDIENYLTLDSVSLYEVTDGGEMLVSRQPVPAPTLVPSSSDAKPIPTGGGGGIGDIITIGERIWRIIEKNKPVVKQKYGAISAVPSGVKAWDELEGWSEPVIKTFKLLYTNKFNQNVVEFTYRVAYTYGGSYQGKGKYLSRVEIDHSMLNVAWGYKFTAGGEAMNVTNVGTKDEPLAAMEVRLDWGVDTVIKHMDQSVRYYVRGDGLLKDITDGNIAAKLR
jgi:hypothetical protein